MTPIVPALWQRLAPYRDRPYGHDYPRELDCSSLASSVLRDHYGAAITSDVWAAINLSRPGCGPWDGVLAVADALGAWSCLPYAGPERPEPGRLHYVQFWRGLGEDGSIVAPTPSRRGSSGHVVLWLADGTEPWGGVCVEANRPHGVRCWDAYGIRRIADMVATDGRLSAPLGAMDWSERAGGWDSWAWVVLP